MLGHGNETLNDKEMEKWRNNLKCLVGVEYNMRHKFKPNRQPLQNAVFKTMYLGKYSKYRFMFDHTCCFILLRLTPVW